MREQNSRMITVEDRPVQDKDIVTIDFEGFMDGVPFDGGKGEDYNLTIGSHSFIDTFEDQLIGKNIGEECEVNVTFPENYQAAELAGKPALFKVTVKKIQEKELPELNDEFAEEVSEFDTLEEYKEDTRKKLQERKEEAAKGEYQTEVLKKIVENAEMVIPDPMIDYEAENMVNDYAQRLQMQGLSIDMYMQYTGQTMEQMKEQMKDQARTRIENSLVLEAVAEAESARTSRSVSSERPATHESPLPTICRASSVLPVMRSSMRDSSVPSQMKVWTNTVFVCPMRCALSVA